MRLIANFIEFSDPKITLRDVGTDWSGRLRGLFPGWLLGKKFMSAALAVL